MMQQGWYAALHALAGGRIRRELREDPRVPERSGGLWFHMASVGEVNGMIPFLRRFREAYSGPLWCSATTRTGLARLRASLQDLPGVDMFRFPLDHPPYLADIFARHPRALALIETELWPGLLQGVRKHRIPLLILNGRMRHRTYQMYRWIPSIRSALSGVRRAYVQTQWDAYRFAMLGVPRNRIRVTGNWKMLFPHRSDHPLTRSDLGLSESDPVVILASVRSREEELALRLIRQVHATHPGVRFLLAPRHLDRLPMIHVRLERMGLGYRRWSEGVARWDTPVLVLDTLGELLRFFPLGHLAVVFGSFAPYGGHNLLEPISAGVPVVFGPYIQNVRDMAARILRAGAGIQVSDGVELVHTLRNCLTDTDLLARLRAAAQAFPRSGEHRVTALIQELKEILRVVS